MADIKISQVTPVATVLADSDMFPGSKSGGGSERYTGALIKSDVLNAVDDLTAETSLTDAMKTHIIDASGNSKSSTIALLKRFMDGPIGTYKYYDADFPNVPVLVDWWVECDGSTISDSDSPFDGYRTRNYNGADVILTGIVWASGVATIPAVDVTALAVGDQVSGGAIATNTYISDITGTTVTLNDTAISATVDTTFTNEGRFIRGGAVSGIGKKDAFQGHEHVYERATLQTAISAGPGASGYTIASWPNTDTEDIVDDGAHGTPRPDSETRPIYTSQVVIFKIK